jgi:hypothetical protein
VVGVDYSLTPTCATCHMSATPNQPVTHDVGERMSWTLRPVLSRATEGSRTKRDSMKDVCRQCHGPRHVEGFYASFDGLVNLYNEKFARPAAEIMEILRRNGSLRGTDGRRTEAGFGSDVEWIFWELWHHEGRRARHGAAMMGPDYAWWHGMYEVSKHFYFRFIPAVRKLRDREANRFIVELLRGPFHAWLSEDKAVTAEKLRSGRMAEVFKDMYRPPWLSAPADEGAHPSVSDKQALRSEGRGTAEASPHKGTSSERAGGSTGSPRSERGRRASGHSR